MTRLLYAADVIRVLGVLLFGYAAYNDLENRRVYDNVWLPLVALGLISLSIDVIYLYMNGFGLMSYLFGVGISVGVVGGIGFVFGVFRLIGGADGKALMVLSVLYPYPLLFSPVFTPLSWGDTSISLLSLDIIVNAAVVFVFYVCGIAAINISRGDIDLQTLFFAKKVPISSLESKTGSLYESSSGITYSGVDLDALRMYLRWRGVNIACIRENPTAAKHPDSITQENDPTDGRVGTELDVSSTQELPIDGVILGDEEEIEDEWGVGAFVESTDNSLYGATKDQLRDALELVSTDDVEQVYVSPGVPLIVPLFVGLVVSLLIGNVVVLFT
jgi:preflagellin peptidase FlaK